MKTKDVELGKVYVVKVSGKLTRVRLVEENVYGGWNGKNLDTGRKVRIRSAARLRREASTEPKRIIPPLWRATADQVNRFLASEGAAVIAWAPQNSHGDIGCRVADYSEDVILRAKRILDNLSYKTEIHSDGTGDYLIVSA